MRSLLLVLLCGLLVLAVGGCAPRADVFAPFQAGYLAEVTGELYGMPFSATVQVARETGEGEPAATVTFYAPEVLSGTRVEKSGTGEITVHAGGLSLPDAGGIGAALFSLFPTGGEITETALTDEGYTRVCGKGFTLTLLSDGTPIEIKTDAVSAKVVRWEQG